MLCLSESKVSDSVPGAASSSKVKEEVIKKEEDEEDYSNEDLSDVTLSTVAEELASMVALSGEEVEAVARQHNADEDQLA